MYSDRADPRSYVATGTSKRVPDVVDSAALERAVALFDIPLSLLGIDTVVDEVTQVFAVSPEKVQIDTSYDRELPAFKIPVMDGRYTVSVSMAIHPFVHLKGDSLDHTYLPKTVDEMLLITRLHSNLRGLAIRRGMKGVLPPQF
ncbi:MAG: hypothetical protein Q7R96_00855 [Nanoarchaeota archaeon]|nr:hypothetical protein [Nanoarchaeota archaeon]